ncbi:MAG: alpha-glucosidase [Lachnospiraceae bacterium]|nr:alpha-glucosidase [Lachnospiraceae bacterium]
MKTNQWYKDKVFYQIWPRSFKDGNGDGMGDLWGVYEKLDYIKALGCDGIWFSPLYPSPGVDCGYDISDYMDIAEEFGGMEAFKKVLNGAHERGMKVIMDLVVNHTSDQHEWFQKSRQRIEPYTDYYIWRPAKPNGKLPNNWDSLFEGKAWAWDEVRQEYYMHLFAIQQADLNMDNPLVREEVKKILRFWLDMGVDGFREDVITFISKAEGLPNDYIMPASKGIGYFNHGPHLHEYLAEFNRDVFSRYDCMTLAEAPMVTPKVALKYIDETKEPVLDMMIQFSTQEADCLFTDYFHMPFSLRKLKRAYSGWQNGLEGKGWNMLYIENHDHPRMVSRYGSEKFRDESAKMLAVSYLFLKGTPFIYQGQEIGMTNWYPDDPELYEDVQTRWQYEHVATKKSPEKRLERLWHGSRDSARTPVQWDDSENAGFTTGTPWFYVNENYREINVAVQEQDGDSVLNFYRRAIALRKELSCVRDGDYREYGKCSSKLYTYSREDEKEKILVVCSFSEKSVNWKIPSGFDLNRSELILCNCKESEVGVLKPYEARVYRWKNNEKAKN